jgi:hypothetical protein
MTLKNFKIVCSIYVMEDHDYHDDDIFFFSLYLVLSHTHNTIHYTHNTHNTYIVSNIILVYNNNK